MKKVISYCLWGTENRYIKGMLRNIQLARDIYPGWTIYIYLGKDADIWLRDLLRKTAADHGVSLEIRSCNIADWRLMLERFRAIIEVEVDVMISRDADSRLTLREKVAVDEWLASDKQWHVMHEHPFHAVPMLGGMWGVKKMPSLGNFKAALNNWKAEDRLQTDQEFLAQQVWPNIQGIVMNHDDGFFTHIWPGRPFPTKRQGCEFVGATVNADETMVSEQLNVLKKVLRIH